MNDRRRAAQSFYKIGCLFSLFLPSCPSVALLRFLILLFLFMSGNVHPNPGPIFPCSVCAGNVTWRGKSVQCCACSKWVRLRCSQLSLSKFRTLGSSHSWSCPPCRITVTPSSDSADMYTSTVQSGPPLLMQRSCPTLVSKPLIPHLPILYLLPLPPPPPSLAPASTPSDSLRVLQSNAGGLQARSTELLHFLSSHPVDLICIQKSNLNSSSSFRIPGFSALRSDRTHSRSGILSPDATHGEEIFDWVISLTSSLSMTLTRPPFSIAPLAVASLLTSPLLPPLLPFLAPGGCFKTWVLTTYQFFYLFLSLRPIAPTSVPLPSIFRKLAGMALPLTLTLTVL